MPNPFKPTAGMTPPVLIGREDDITDFSYALDDGVGAPGRLMYITGARGVGKTVMLNAMGDTARRRGWLVIDETADTGFISRLTTALNSANGSQSHPSRQSLKAMKLPSGSISIEGMPISGSLDLGSMEFAAAERALDFRNAMTNQLDELEPDDRGILITLDEVQASSIDEIRPLATAVQHLIREQRNVAFLFAGLPSIVEHVINDHVLTFLRRAERKHLEDVPLAAVAASFADIIGRNGKQTEDGVIDALAQATNGYPFMIQLVGYWTWRQAETRRDGPLATITMEDAANGIRQARIKLGDMVHGPALDGLSPMGRDYLLAMAQDDGPSATGEIARRLERDQTYANVYRTQLIKEDIIYQSSYGFVDFKLPYLRDYLREHGAWHQMRRTIEQREQ